MTPHKLIQQLINYQGPCMRFCAYCPEDHNTAEVKECVESMYKQIYLLQQDKDKLLEDIIKLHKAYKEATGHDYQDDSGTDGV